MGASELTAPGGTPVEDRRAGPTVGQVAPVLLVVCVAAFATLSPAHAVIAALTGCTLVVLSAVDLERGVIPNRIVLPATALVLGMQLALFPAQAAEWLLAPTVVALVLALPLLVGRNWIGMGDIKLIALIGVALGWGVIAALFLACVCVFPLTFALLVREGPTALKRRIPFGPFLSLGALIVLFVPHLAALPAG